MKIEKNGNNLVVFLNQKKIDKIDFSDKVLLEKYFQKLFFKLNEIYNLNIHGSYEIVLYNNSYGLILEIVSQDIEYYDYYNEISMQITISDDNDVIYRLNGCLPLSDNYDVFIYGDEIYIKPFCSDFFNDGIIVENCDIVYGKKAKHILKSSYKVSNEFVQLV